MALAAESKHRCEVARSLLEFSDFRIIIDGLEDLGRSDIGMLQVSVLYFEIKFISHYTYA